MRCGLYDENGALVGEGPCGVRRDGAIEMVAQRGADTLRKGDGPLTLVEGPRAYAVRVEDVHGMRQALPDASVVVYHLSPLRRGREASRGLVATLRRILRLAWHGGHRQRRAGIA